MIKVTTLGLGYIGLPTSALIASHKVPVHGIFSLLSGKRAKDIFVSEEVCYSSIVREKSLTTSKIKNNHRIRVSVYIRYYKMLDQREIKVIGASPMPLIYSALNYGVLEFIRTIYVFRISGVPIFKNFMSKLKRFRLRA